jgi:CBS domain-containing protein
MTLTAADLMTGDLRVAHASWSVRRLVEFLSEHDISGAPVVSEQGQLIGVVSLTDVARTAKRSVEQRECAHEYYLLGPAYTYRQPPAEHVDGRLLVQDIMTPAVFDVPLSATAKEIAAIMVSRDIHRIFVTESGMVIGVITALDLLRAFTTDAR